MFQYTLIKHRCLPTQHSWVPATVPSQGASLPLLASASNYCPLQVKSQPRQGPSAARSCRAPHPRAPFRRKSDFTGADSPPRGLGSGSLGGARSVGSRHRRAGCAAPAALLHPRPGGVGAGGGRYRSEDTLSSFSFSPYD